MSEFLRQFSSSLQDPNAQTTDDGNAQAQADSNGGDTFGSPVASDSPAQADPAPVMLADNSPPPAHDDPVVGQNKAVDPNDKSWFLKGTWDIDKPPKVTGGGGDLPGASGQQAEYPQDKDDTPDGGGPKFGGPPPGSTPPGPGYKWDPILQGWRKDKDPDPGPSTPTPQPDPRGPGDYEVPGGDSAVA